jgi:hypothetical protein
VPSFSSQLMATTEIPTPVPRTAQVDRNTRIKPRIVDYLNDWQYVERSIHRLLAGWGRHFCEWDGKSACHRHVWEQAEVVRRLRERIAEFPGGKPDAPVSARLEELANTVLLAPSFEDALDGIYLLLSKALAASYVAYVQNAHPVHDAPTVRLLHEITGAKEQEWLWYREWRREHPHQTDTDYKARVKKALANCGSLMDALPVEGTSASPCGVHVDFFLPRSTGCKIGSPPKYNFMPFVRAEFAANVDARRLFWAYGYMLEKSLPDDQLKWIWYGHDMPWDFQYDVSRHLWDESRHGDSGLSRLKDFGIAMEEIGFPGYGPAQFDLSEPGEPLGSKELYDAVFFIGMVAESGHFEVKNEAFTDFKNGNDLESAEMMLFDIIDETAHVQYAHKWLPVLAEKAGIDNSGYRTRGIQERKRRQAEIHDKIEKEKEFVANSQGTPDYAFYQNCLRRIRESAPLEGATEIVRSPLPM